MSIYYNKKSIIALSDSTWYVLTMTLLSIVVGFKLDIIYVLFKFINNLYLLVLTAFAIFKGYSTISILKCIVPLVEVIEYDEISILFKFLLAITLNHIFTKLFLKNFWVKHKEYFNQTLNWKYLKTILNKLILCFIFIFCLRILIRNSLSIFFFQDKELITLVLTLLWVLPLSSYVFNLSIKYMTNQRIEKEDWNLFNENVANSINLYILFYGMIFLYLNFYYFKDVYIFFLKKYEDTLIISSNNKLSILPEDYPLVFSSEYGDFSEKRSWLGTNNTRTRNYLFLDMLTGGYYGPLPAGHITFRASTFGFSPDRIKSQCHVVNAILRREISTNKPFLMDTLTVSRHVSSKFTFGQILVDKYDGTCALWLAITNTTEVVPKKPVFWCEYTIRSPENINEFRRILDEVGVELRKTFEAYPISEIFLMSPFKISSYDSTNTYGMHGMRVTKTHSVGVNVQQLTHINRLNLPLPLQANNLEEAFKSPYNRHFLDKMNCLNFTELENKNFRCEALVSNPNFIGHIWRAPEGPSKGALSIIHTNDSSLPLVRSDIHSSYIYQGIQELNKKLGIHLYVLMRELSLYTQPSSLYANLYKLPMLSPSYSAFLCNEKTTLTLPWKDLYTFINDNSNIHEGEFNNFLQAVYSTLPYLERRNPHRVGDVWDGYSDIDKLNVLNNLKKELSSQLSPRPFAISIPYEEENITMFRKSPFHNKLIVCLSNRKFFDGLDWDTDYKKLTILPSIDQETRIRLSSHLSKHKFTDGWTCLENRTKVNILLLDNFCAEFAISDTYCHNICSHVPENRELESVIWKDNNGNFKKTLNLLKPDDLRLFLDHLNVISNEKTR